MIRSRAPSHSHSAIPRDAPRCQPTPQFGDQDEAATPGSELIRPDTADDPNEARSHPALSYRKISGRPSAPDRGVGFAPTFPNRPARMEVCPALPRCAPPRKRPAYPLVRQKCLGGQTAHILSRPQLKEAALALLLSLRPALKDLFQPLPVNSSPNSAPSQSIGRDRGSTLNPNPHEDFVVAFEPANLSQRYVVRESIKPETPLPPRFSALMPSAAQSRRAGPGPQSE
jgi:hypothetical protein